jgi:hypothetical protein
MMETITPYLAQISLALSNRNDATFLWFSCIDVIKSIAANKIHKEKKKKKKRKNEVSKSLKFYSKKKSTFFYL